MSGSRKLQGSRLQGQHSRKTKESNWSWPVDLQTGKCPKWKQLQESRNRGRWFERREWERSRWQSSCFPVLSTVLEVWTFCWKRELGRGKTNKWLITFGTISSWRPMRECWGRDKRDRLWSRRAPGSWARRCSGSCAGNSCSAKLPSGRHLSAIYRKRWTRSTESTNCSLRKSPIPLPYRN